jgi:hypothetical protein
MSHHPTTAGRDGALQVRLAAYELGHDHLVHDRVCVFHNGGDAFARLVEAAHDLGQSAVFRGGY